MEHKSIIGIDIGATNIKAGLIKENQIVSKSLNPTIPERDKDEILETLFHTIDEVIGRDTKSIGIGVPGLISPQNGQLLNIQNIPSWKYLPLKEIIENRYQVETFVNNDANCFALGEKYFGKGKDVNNLVAITLGTGVGSGIIANNKLVTGIYCGAGEIGALPFKDRDFEFYCSSQFFIKKHNTTGEKLYLLADENDVRALDIFYDFGSFVGKMIHQILYFLAPEMVILGGSISKAFPFFKNGLLEELEDFPFEVIRDNVIIDRSDLNEIAILGAAAQYYDAHVQESISQFI